MNVKLGRKIDWTEAIKQMSLGKMCAVTHCGTNTFHMMCDSTDQFRSFNIKDGTFLKQYLDSDDIKEGVWNECEIEHSQNLKLLLNVNISGAYHINGRTVQLNKGDQIVGNWYEQYLKL